MKKTLILLAITASIFVACEKKQTYTYIEYNEEDDLFGGTDEKKEEKTFEAYSDSIATIEAYSKFTISQKVNSDMVEAYEKTYSKPVRYEILTETGKDITFLEFKGRDSILASVYSNIYSTENSLKKGREDLKEKMYAGKKFDSITYNKLISKFEIKEEEFSSPQKKWIIPKSKPKYIDNNYVYSYFQADKNNNANNLRLVIQYAAEDWLFIKRIQFLIDGNLFEVSAYDVKTDHNGGRIWEWTDITMDTELKIALEFAKSVKIKLTGQNYARERILSKKEITSLNETIAIYYAMKGL